MPEVVHMNAEEDAPERPIAVNIWFCSPKGRPTQLYVTAADVRFFSPAGWFEIDHAIQNSLNEALINLEYQTPPDRWNDESVTVHVSSLDARTLSRCVEMRNMIYSDCDKVSDVLDPTNPNFKHGLPRKLYGLNLVIFEGCFIPDPDGSLTNGLTLLAGTALLTLPLRKAPSTQMS